MKTKHKKGRIQPQVVKVQKTAATLPRKVLGITANLKNLLIAVALLFAFLGGFFKVYNWVDTTYARLKSLQKLEVRFEHKTENDVLNSMYSRFWTLDNMFNLSINPSKIPVEIRTEYNDLKAKIKLQEEKVKILQEKVCK